MSRENSEIASMVDLRADFDFWVSEKNWKEAWVAINAMGEYDENEALRMHQELNRERAHYENECEDIKAGHEDPRDVADRTNY